MGGVDRFDQNVACYRCNICSLYSVWKQHCRMHFSCTKQDNLGQVVFSETSSVFEDTLRKPIWRSMANQFCTTDQLPTSRPTRGFFQTSGMTVLNTGKQRVSPSDDVVTVVGRFVSFAWNVTLDCTLIASRTITLDDTCWMTAMDLGLQCYVYVVYILISLHRLLPISYLYCTCTLTFVLYLCCKLL